MRIFKTKWFARFARKNLIKDADLCRAIADAERGLIDADLGSGVIKQRIARKNQGKSGGFRSIIYFRLGDRAVFVFGFAKSEMDNISPDDEDDYKAAAEITLSLDDTVILKLMEAGELVEVFCEEEVQE